MACDLAMSGIEVTKEQKKKQVKLCTSLIICTLALCRAKSGEEDPCNNRNSLFLR